MSIFDEIIDRNGTDCIKIDRYKKYGNAIPMWVADMDFKSPKCIIDALETRVKHGVFGYTDFDNETKKAFIDFTQRWHGWDIDKNWLVCPSGVVSSMNIVCGMLKENESVITNTPIYPYFVTSAQNMKREVKTVKMHNFNNRWMFDFDEFEKAITKNTKLFFLCNPYNPGGTVFTKEELLKIADIAKKHDLIICSDEIHCDLVIDKNAKHIPIASLNDEVANRTITLMAPSKTFNIAGLQSSFAVIKNETLRKEFISSMGHINGGVNLLGITATKAAYSGGDEWLKELKVYLAQNLEILKEFVSKNPKIKFLSMQATYLAWLDCKELCENPYELFLKNGVIFNDGKGFISGGAGFVRLNFGTSRTVLFEVLKRMQKAIDSVK
ncbi:MAG: MalY/PatB family protein [Campylobacteraceae bacterium]